MSFEQPVSAAEADLERLLAIEPSAGFRARVRERVAAESMREQRWSWTLVLVRAGALVTIGVALLTPTLRPDVDRPAPPSAPPVFLAAVHRPDAGPLVVRPESIPAPGIAPPRTASPAPREQEVVWDARDAYAIARLVDLAHEGTIVSPPPVPERTPLAVQPLSVSPVTIFSQMLQQN